MVDNARGGDDTLTGGVLMYGDAQFMYDNTRGGDDTLTGSGNGDAHEMHNNARGGNDTLLGGATATPTPCTITPAAATTR